MECLIDPDIDYSTIGNVLRKQRDFVIRNIIALSNNGKEYPGLPATFFKKIVGKDPEQISRIQQIPGISKTNWDTKEYNELKKRPKGTSFKSSCKSIIDQLEKHKSVFFYFFSYCQCWPFKKAVSREEVPDYYEIIKEPMDIQTLRTNLSNNLYKTKEAFKNDIELIFKNAKKYNQRNTVYYKLATEMETVATTLLGNLSYDFEDPVTGMQDSTVKKIKS